MCRRHGRKRVRFRALAGILHRYYWLMHPNGATRSGSGGRTSKTRPCRRPEQKGESTPRAYSPLLSAEILQLAGDV
jgi:hypothetical protein